MRLHRIAIVFALISLALQGRVYSWRLPVSGFVVTSDFGPRNYAELRTNYLYQFHKAIDFHATVGTPLRAVSDGTIARIIYNNANAGNFLEYSHTCENGVTHLIRYLHLSSSTGSPVRTWEVLPDTDDLPLAAGEGLIVFRTVAGAISRVLVRAGLTPLQIESIRAALILSADVPIGSTISELDDTPIAYSGDTGLGPAHGHIDFDYSGQVVNPFFHLPYFGETQTVPGPAGAVGPHSSRGLLSIVPGRIILRPGTTVCVLPLILRPRQSWTWTG